MEYAGLFNKQICRAYWERKREKMKTKQSNLEFRTEWIACHKLEILFLVIPFLSGICYFAFFACRIHYFILRLFFFAMASIPSLVYFTFSSSPFWLNVSDCESKTYSNYFFFIFLDKFLVGKTPKRFVEFSVATKKEVFGFDWSIKIESKACSFKVALLSTWQSSPLIRKFSLFQLAIFQTPSTHTSHMCVLPKESKC